MENIKKISRNPLCQLRVESEQGGGLLLTIFPEKITQDNDVGLLVKGELGYHKS